MVGMKRMERFLGRAHLARRLGMDVNSNITSPGLYASPTSGPTDRVVTELPGIQIGGINVATASRADRHDGKRWARRMNHGLKGVQIFMLGVGRGARSSST